MLREESRRSAVNILYKTLFLSLKKQRLIFFLPYYEIKFLQMEFFLLLCGREISQGGGFFMPWKLRCAGQRAAPHRLR